jgi:transmembrane sensor
MEYDDRIAELAKRWLNGSITAAEEKEFADWYNLYPDDVVELAPGFANNLEELRQRSYAQLEQKIKRSEKIHVLNASWVRYAAAAVLVISLGAYLWNYTKKEKPSVATADPYPVKQDALPGGNRAVLTLSDGKQIVLDTAATGALAKDGGAEIRKSENGEIKYLSPLTSHLSPAASRLPSPVMLYNTMTTPRGGQYHLTLPDGSRVWLNAMSSIVYPVLFSGKERKVSITGEVYFEVSKDKSKPFIVETRTDVIEVLGTHFNIKSYENEGSVKTSLIEGSVRVKSRSALTSHFSLVLAPGQAFIDGKVVSTNTEQDVAWKNGYFNFDGADLKTVMQQLERWYDIDVVYKGQSNPGKYKFQGEMQRSLRLSQIIRILSAMEIKFSIEGKKLIVTQ